MTIPGRFSALLIVLFMVAGIAAGQGQGNGLGSASAPAPAAENRLPRIVCTVFPIFAITAKLTEGSGVEPVLLLPANAGCPHEYSLTPGDLLALEKADLIIANGLGFEPFAADLAGKFGPGKVFGAAGDLSSRDGDVSGTPESRFRPDGGVFRDLSPAAHGTVNPHVFATPSGAASLAENIASALVKVDPARSDRYRANAASFSAECALIGKTWKESAERLAGRAVVLTHESLEPIARELGLSVAAGFHSAEEGERTPGELMELMEKARSGKAAAILEDGQHVDPVVRILGADLKLPVVSLNPLTVGPPAPPSDFIVGLLGNIPRLIEEGLAARAPGGK